MEISQTRESATPNVGDVGNGIWASVAIFVLDASRPIEPGFLTAHMALVQRKQEIGT